MSDKELDKDLNLEKDFFIFSKDEKENPTDKEESLIELEIYGISMGPDQSRPVVVLRDRNGRSYLPVPVAPVQAGVILSHTSPSVTPTSVHRFTEVLLNSLNIKFKKCVFVEIKGHHQFVRMYMDNHPNYGSLKIRADEAISLCLYFGIKMYATKDFVQKSRVMNAEMDDLLKSVQGVSGSFGSVWGRPNGGFLQ